MKATVFVLLLVTSAGLGACATAQDVLSGDRPVRPDRVALVLNAVRRSVAGKALRLVRREDRTGNSLAEIVIGPGGVPRFMRRHLSYEGGIVGVTDGVPFSTHYRVDGVVINEFTGASPCKCDGARRGGEFIIKYTNEGHGWTAAIEARRDLGYPAGAFDILTGTLVSEIGRRGFVDGRTARALVAPWTPSRPDGRAQPPIVIGDPFPNVRGNPPRRAETTQKLWIDVDSLLPLQWETPVDAFAFEYDPTLVISRPDGITPPACVP